jgi:putative NADPH-quinone reductase
VTAPDILKGGKIMKIIILQGSPNRNGSTAMLAEAFAKGAEKAGHETEIINVAEENIHPCTGCISCGYEGPCAQKDGMESIRRALLHADMVVFATPLYYFGMTAQLKTVVDRFCAFNSSLNRRHLKSALLAVAWNSADWTFDSLESHYRTLVRYLNLEDRGEILGYGCGTPSMTKSSGYVEKAYELGALLN